MRGMNSNCSSSGPPSRDHHAVPSIVRWTSTTSRKREITRYGSRLKAGTTGDQVPVPLAHSSYAGLTRVSITLHETLAKAMDCRVKPGNDYVDDAARASIQPLPALRHPIQKRPRFPVEKLDIRRDR